MTTVRRVNINMAADVIVSSKNRFLTKKSLDVKYDSATKEEIKDFDHENICKM